MPSLSTEASSTFSSVEASTTSSVVLFVSFLSFNIQGFVSVLLPYSSFVEPPTRINSCGSVKTIAIPADAPATTGIVHPNEIPTLAPLLKFFSFLFVFVS